ncbi:hypothetical protein [Arthrobacter globiformis]|nr:hypothetical protein [Arthrobacter globiformis]MDQ0617390.1 hypothetical protein [Arthrobacter globiformis]
MIRVRQDFLPATETPLADDGGMLTAAEQLTAAALLEGDIGDEDQYGV